MAEVATVCEECEGKRFQASVLEYKLAGRDITEVLAMSVADALAFFASGEAKVPAARAVLRRMADVGLGYLTLGQPLTTLSGGERQRLKLAMAGFRLITVGPNGVVIPTGDPDGHRRWHLRTR